MPITPSLVAVSINGKTVHVPSHTTVAVAAMIAGEMALRHSVNGQPRGALCGMGICFECRLTINGQEHCRSCQIQCREGMQVVTD